MSRQKKCQQISEAKHIDFTPLSRDRDALAYFEKRLAVDAGHFDIKLIPYAEVLRYCIRECFRRVNHGRGRREYHRVLNAYDEGRYQRKRNMQWQMSIAKKYSKTGLMPPDFGSYRNEDYDGIKPRSVRKIKRLMFYRGPTAFSMVKDFHKRIFASRYTLNLIKLGEKHALTQSAADLNISHSTAREWIRSPIVKQAMREALERALRKSAEENKKLYGNMNDVF